MTNKLSTWLSDQKLSDKAFADRLGVAPSTVHRLKNGERSPSIDLLARIEKETAGAVTARDFYPSNGRAG